MKTTITKRFHTEPRWFLLSIAMMIVCVCCINPVSAQSTAAQSVHPVTDSRPFPGIWAWCWAPTDKWFTNLLPMLWIHNRNYGNPYGMALASRRLPRNRAAIFLWNAAPKLLSTPLDTCRTPDGTSTKFPSPWLSAGAKAIAARMQTFFLRFKAAGGKLNYLVLDYEAGLSCWQIKLPDMQAIEADPRSAELKKQLGFSFLSSAFFAGPNRRRWNLVMGQRIAAALNTAFFQPARAEFPEVCGSNFGGEVMLPPHVVPDFNNHYQSISSVFGNCQSPGFYGKLGGLAYVKKGGAKSYGRSPFAILRYELKYMQGIQQSSSLPIVPWVAYRGFVNTDGYYKELIYQLALRGVNQFLYFNPRMKHGATVHDDQYLNHLLSVIQEKLGPAPGMAVPTGNIGWTSPLLVAARHTTTGQIIYRISVPPGTNQIEILPIGRWINVTGKTGLWIIGKSNWNFHIQ